MKLVVDVGVALRWYVDSPLSSAAVSLLNTDRPLIAPDLVVAEIANATWKLVPAAHIREAHGVCFVASAPSAPQS